MSMTATLFLKLEKEFCSETYFEFHGVPALKRKIASLRKFIQSCKSWLDKETSDDLKLKLKAAEAELDRRLNPDIPCRDCRQYRVVWNYPDNCPEEVRNCRQSDPFKCPRRHGEKKDGR